MRSEMVLSVVHRRRQRVRRSCSTSTMRNYVVLPINLRLNIGCDLEFAHSLHGLIRTVEQFGVTVGGWKGLTDVRRTTTTEWRGRKLCDRKTSISTRKRTPTGQPV